MLKHSVDFSQLFCLFVSLSHLLLFHLLRFLSKQIYTDANKPRLIFTSSAVFFHTIKTIIETDVAIFNSLPFTVLGCWALIGDLKQKKSFNKVKMKIFLSHSHQNMWSAAVVSVSLQPNWIFVILPQNTIPYLAIIQLMSTLVLSMLWERANRFEQ